MIKSHLSQTMKNFVSNLLKPLANSTKSPNQVSNSQIQISPKSALVDIRDVILQSDMAARRRSMNFKTDRREQRYLFPLFFLSLNTYTSAQTTNLLCDPKFVSTEAFWKGTNIVIKRGSELSKEDIKKLVKGSLHVHLSRFFGNVTNIKNKEYTFYAWESVHIDSLATVVGQ